MGMACKKKKRQNAEKGFVMMKKAGTLLLIGLLAIAFAAGCVRTPAKPAEEDGKMLVYTSFYPMYDFAQKIGGYQVRVVNMVPTGTEPHDWEPTAPDIAGLEKAKVFIYNGAGLEHWTKDILSSLQNKDLLAVEAAAGITLQEGHSHEESGHSNEDPASASDPHVWLNPLYAKKQMEAITAAFVKADPTNSAYYEENFAKYSNQLDALDNEFREALAHLPKKEIIVSHAAFGYLCDAYGLTQVGIEGLAPDSEPDPARMAEIIEFAKAHNVKVIFFEELVSPKVAETIARAIGAQTAVLSPLEGLSDEQQANGDDYFAVMRQNLAAIKTALQ